MSGEFVQRLLEKANRRALEIENGESEGTFAALAEAGARLDEFQRERLSFVGDRKGHARLPWAAIAADLMKGMAEA